MCFPLESGMYLVWQSSGQTASLLCIYAPGLEVLHVFAAMALGLTAI